MSKFLNILCWIGAVFISAIFLDSLRFKFTGHPTPQHIFETLKEWSGIGLFYPAGPWVIGLGELLASFLLLFIPIFFFFSKNTRMIRISQALGALIALGIMSGAIIFHLFTPLGIETPIKWEDGQIVEQGAFLFYAACVSWLFALCILFYRRKELRQDALQFS